MAITETAQRNHERWFPHHQSTLKVSDPEFIEYFDNFAFDEVASRSSLDDRSRLLVILAALIASQALGEYRVMVRAALNVGVTPVELKELVYQAVPYCGIGVVFDFLHATNEILLAAGVALPLEPQATTTAETRMAQGMALQKDLFGGLIDQMREAAPTDQVHIQDFLTGNCFGDTYTRTGLDLPLREQLTFAMLVSLRGCEAQVKGHVLGNVQAGNGRAVLVDVLTQLLPYLGYPRTLNALRCLNEVLPDCR